MLHQMPCPNCKIIFNGAADDVGTTVACTSCDELFVFEPPQAAPDDVPMTPVPAPQPVKVVHVKPAPVTARPEVAATARAADFEDDDSSAYDVGGVDHTPRCPHCANPLVSANSIICLECGYNLQTREMGYTKKTYEVTTGDHVAHLVPAAIGLFVILWVAIFGLWFTLMFPYILPDDSSWQFMAHESMQLFTIILLLGTNWAIGYFVYRRLVFQPAPEEAEKR